MAQGDAGVDLDASIGYLLKETSSLLRSRMEEALHPIGLTVTQYACLELLAQRPGLSSSALARGVFVTRQSMAVLIKTLQEDGLVSRPAEAPVGKVLPTQLTAKGRRRLATATAAVRSVELAMLSDLSEPDQASVFRALQQMSSSLREVRTGGQAAGTS